MKLTERNLDRRIADQVPNTADRLPWFQPSEPFHIGADWKEPPPVREIDPFDVERDTWFVWTALTVIALAAFGPWVAEWIAEVLL